MASMRETNTMAEGCQRILNEITKMKVMPDSDLPFLVKLETDILSYLRAPTPQANPSPEMQMMGPAMGQVMGGGPGPGMPNPDEMRRLTGLSGAMIPGQ